MKETMKSSVHTFILTFSSLFYAANEIKEMQAALILNLICHDFNLLPLNFIGSQHLLRVKSFNELLLSASDYQKNKN